MSKLERLRKNIEVIRKALTNTLTKLSDLRDYTGFGGLGFILNSDDKSTWSKSDLPYYEDTMRLKQIIRENVTNEEWREKYWQSLKSSTLTAYYTPDNFVAIMLSTIMYQLPIRYKFVLDPAAGKGIFGNGVLAWAKDKENYEPDVYFYEKDLLTGKILEALGQHRHNYFAHIDGFETIKDRCLGKFDLVTTNVPFGDIRVFDPAYTHSDNVVRRDAVKYIHRYYVLKGLDCLRDGGIEAYITTSNYLNHDGEQIAEALKQSRLIGAYRLPNNLFKESGTEAGTDLLVLQNDVHKTDYTPDETFLMTPMMQGDCPTNMYFVMHPDHIICTDTKVDTDAYGRPGFVYTHKGDALNIALDMNRVFKEDFKKNVNVKLYNENFYQKQNAQNAQTENAQSYSKEPTPEEKSLMAIYDAYRQLYDYEAKELQENAELRKQLNDLYDAYVGKHGALNDKANKNAVNGVNAELLALEVKDGKAWRKADIFMKPVAFSMDEIHGADSAHDALAQSLNDYGYPDVMYMTALTGMEESELMMKLDGDVYWNPLSEKYEITAKFISGNVVEKIDAIRKKYDIKVDAAGKDMELATQNLDPRVVRSLRALEDAVPTPIPFEELDFNLGERWIDCKLYEAFGNELLSVPGSKQRLEIRYDALMDKFAVSASDSWNETIRTKYHVESECSSFYGVELFVHALQNTCPKMYRYRRCANGQIECDSNGSYLKEEDPEKTQLANAKVEDMRNKWTEWLMERPKDVKDNLANKYNRRFNCFVKPRYDGSHQTFPGLDFDNLDNKFGIKSLYQSQKDCIWMLVQNGGGICDHEVGTGKTLIMCVAAHEMKRLGLVHKPMIIGMKANVGAIAETYQAAYPQAKILFASSHDVNGKDRVAFFNRMKNNDYDCIIMSHDSFSKLPQSDEVQQAVMEDELKQLEDALHIVDKYGWSVSSQLRKGLERRKRNLEAKLLDMQHAMREKKDKVTDFAMMGIDHIFVDESHVFKNLRFTTRHERVAGLGNTQGSTRAYNLLMAIRTIQRRTGKDLGATFLSGTTVTNSLTELYSLFRYLRPNAMAKQDITCFDAWAAIFTKKSTEFEFSLTNQIILKERFRYFIKVPELAQFYNEITDYRTAADVGIERPQKHARLLNIEPTKDQQEFIQTLMKFAKTGDFSLIGKDFVTDKQQRAKMLYATDMARKMALDMRMIDESYPDDPNTKSSWCARLVKQYYDKYDSVKGTQLIFSDLSTYQGKDKGWNVYEDIKQKLVEMGIPSKEIRFIQECKSVEAKEKMVQDVNDGKIRVLFGSTQMLGTGVNAQKRVVCVHHLDTPWRPSDLEQRDGRAIRKGNEVAKLYANNTVDIIIYAVRRSLDAYKFGLLNNKQTFISQLKRGQLSVRTLDEGSMDENSGMNFAEYMAVLSGNRDLLDRAKLEKQIAAMEAERKAFYRDKASQEQKRERLKHDNEVNAKNIQDAKSDLSRFKAVAQTLEDGKVVNAIKLDNFTPYALDKDGKPTDVVLTPEKDGDEFDKAVGTALTQMSKVLRTNGTTITIGSIYGFPIKVWTQQKFNEFSHTMEYVNLFSVHGSNLVYPFNGESSYNRGRINGNSARITGTLALGALQRITAIINGWQQNSEENTEHIHQLDEIIAQPWGKDKELAKLRSDLSALDLRINQKLKEEEKKEGKAA